MPVVKTKGSASSQGFGEFAQQGGGGANYIDDVFSTYLYTGNGSTQTITNGIDLADKGGMFWLKGRNIGISSHYLFDTARGAGNYLSTDSTSSQGTGLTQSFLSDGMSFTGSGEINPSGGSMVSWTFAKQAKFFDVVTYTGTGSVLTLNHSLGSTPGFIIVKGATTSYSWFCYHRSTGETKALYLNSTNAATTNGSAWNNTAPTSTQFTIGTNGEINQSGQTYVAYLFAHDAGGFGAAGTDNVISCGSYTGNGTSGVEINLGYEPQWVMIKRTDITGNWTMIDTMRGFPVGSNDSAFWANTTNAELSGQAGNPTATGFYLNGSWSDVNTPGGTYIYIAIRRPMKPPTTGTEVFSPVTASNSQGTKKTTGFVVDLQIQKPIAETTAFQVTDRLRGVSTTSTSSGRNLVTSSTAAESTSYSTTQFWDNTGFEIANFLAGVNGIYWNFRRAPTFFDVVCYTGTGSATTFNHNLTVVPELMIVKSRSNLDEWAVYSASLGATKYLYLNTTNAVGTDTFWNNTAPTSSVFSVGADPWTNRSGGTFVAYLFATVAGVSKVGSYTGTGTVTQTINAGFGASGARYVLIKRTDSTGDWYVFDTARGFTSSSSPYLLLNSTAAQVTGNNGCYAASTGFTLTTNASSTVNVNGGSYIYLAIA